VLRSAVWWKFTDVSEALIALMMEAASTSETSVNVYHCTRRCNPEDINCRLQVGGEDMSFLQFMGWIITVV
jgi:hypothetical protein